jgi:hypothetical protein
MSIDTLLKDEFHTFRRAWMKHCKDLGPVRNDLSYTKCEAYRKLVELGEETLPFIHQVVTNPEDELSLFAGKGWFYLVQEITNNRLAPPAHIVRLPDQMNHYTRLWLSKHRYTIGGDTFPVEEDTKLDELFDHVHQTYPNRPDSPKPN